MAFSFPWKIWSHQKRTSTSSHCHLHPPACISIHRRHCPPPFPPEGQPCLFKFSCSLHFIYLSAILIVSHQYINMRLLFLPLGLQPSLDSFSATTPFPLFFYSWNFQLIFYTPCWIFFFSHFPLNSSNQAFASTTPPRLLSSRLLPTFLLLNSGVSFQPALYLIQLKYLPHAAPFLLDALSSHGSQDASAASPGTPSQPPLLIPPRPLPVGVLWDAVRGTSSYSHQHSLPQWSYPSVILNVSRSW